MNIRVKFLGGAGSVTGSKFLLMVDDFNILVDCGLFQGLKELRLRNWDDLPIAPESIDTVLLTHAHIDHSGYIPLLNKNGFDGKVHCTEPTHELAKILLADSAKLQEEEAAFANKKGYSKHSPAKPLYTIEDAQHAMLAFEKHPFDTYFSVEEGIDVKFFHAGHILGAASIELSIQSGQGVKKIVFSGDLGPSDSPLHFRPSPPKQADILFIESTYGNRDHAELDLENSLRRVILEANEKRGCIIIPAFSLGRTQLILYYLWKIFQNMRSRPVYVDSPMAISVTKLYKQFEAYHRLKSKDDFAHQIFDAPFIHYITEQSKSKVLNNLKEGSIIISASGMATGGRILHHLYHRLPNKQDTILFSGFMAIGTRGRNIADGKESVRVFGEEVKINATIETLEGLSAHADQKELINWATNIKDHPKMTFIIHGEKDQAMGLQSSLSAKGWNVKIPDYLATYNLFDHL